MRLTMTVGYDVTVPHSADLHWTQDGGALHLTLKTTTGEARRTVYRGEQATDASAQRAIQQALDAMAAELKPATP